MDIYLPAGRNLSTKIIIVIHGGGWSGGSKEDISYMVTYFQTVLPQHAVVNMNYRLGTVESPGLYKQLEDVDLAVKFMKSVSGALNITGEFALMGASAGAHLSMLYGYALDPDRNVKAICNVVGPASFDDPQFLQNAFFNNGLVKPFVGNYTYQENSFIYTISSPLFYVNVASPKTISFYGDQDPLIPKTQGALLEEKLDSVGVYNKYYLYQGAGHLNATYEQEIHFYTKLSYFFKYYL
jgi:acetyl esterase/lipase